MLKKLIALSFMLFPLNLLADVIGVEWVDKSKHIIEKEGGLVDIIIPGNKAMIDRSYKEKETLKKEPFPETPGSNNPIDDSVNLLQWNQKLNPTSSQTVSKNLINKRYGLRYQTNQLKDVVQDKCHPYYLDKKLSKIKDLDKYKDEIDHFFKRCDRKLVRSIRNKYTDLIKLSLKKYEVMDNKNVHPLKINFKNNESLEGFLALKPNKRRPLVIVKCGVFCNGNSSTTNNMITSNIYDAGPFHILMVANHTGSRNIKQNKRVNIGGFIEGQEIIKVAQWAKYRSYFKNYISEIHVLGISLGGHGALYSGIFNDEFDEKIISSVIGFCPVTNVQNSVKDVTARGVIGSIVSHAVQDLVYDNRNNIPYLEKHINLSERVDMKRMHQRLAAINIDYINSLDNREFLQPFKGVKINSVNDYYHYNDFNQHNTNLKTPTLIIASKNDPVVRFNRNSGLLNNRKNMKVIRLKKGSHCAAEESYGSYTISKILNNFLIKNSPSLNQKVQIKEEHFNFEQPRISHNEKYAGVRFLTFANLTKVILEYKIYHGEPYIKPFYAFSRSFRYDTIEIDFDDLPFSINVPKNRVEAQILTRWLNTNVHLKVNSTLFNITRTPANKIEWSMHH